jgi:hypothetical protein
VSPFVDLYELYNKIATSLGDKRKDTGGEGSFSNAIYEYMINVFKASLRKQLERYIPADTTAEILGSLGTDGLILTPKYMPYLYGSWSSCSNKQYKWKPVDQLTIDFMVDKESDKKYYGYVAVGSDIIKYMYKDRPSVITGTLENVPAKSIVECRPLKMKDDKVFFEVVRRRVDKDRPNAEMTADSVLNAFTTKIDILYNAYLLSKRNVTSFGHYLNNVFRYMDEENRLRILVKYGIVDLVSPEIKNYMTKLIRRAQLDPSLEFETRIVFSSNCSFYLTNETNNGIVSPVKTYRFYKTVNKETNRRLTCDDIEGDVLPLMMDEKVIKNMETFDLYYPAINSFRVSLSSEKMLPLAANVVNDIMTPDESVAISYQNRILIDNLSTYWTVEIIDSANGSTAEDARKNYMSGPFHKYSNPKGYKTRVEIEFKPMAMFSNALELYKINHEENNQELAAKAEELLAKYLVLEEDRPNIAEVALGTFKQKYDWFNARIELLKSRVKYVSPETIMERYVDVLKQILDVYYT